MHLWHHSVPLVILKECKMKSQMSNYFPLILCKCMTTRSNGWSIKGRSHRFYKTKSIGLWRAYLKFYVKMQQLATLDIAIAIIGNWEIVKWSSSFGRETMSHFMSPSSLMVVNQAVTQSIGFLNNSLWQILVVIPKWQYLWCKILCWPCK